MRVVGRSSSRSSSSGSGRTGGSSGSGEDADADALWFSRVTAAATAFEQRWTMLTLQRVNADLAFRLRKQQQQLMLARTAGSSDEVAEQAQALCRGYAVVIAAMEAANVADDAYQIGRCPVTGLVVAIGEQAASGNRVRQVHGEDAIHLTPDEVASLFASIEGLKSITAIKQQFPGSEVVGRYIDQGT